MVKLATLDQDGNIDSPSKITDRLMSYFFASDFSQSTALYGNIISLPALIQKNSNNPDQVVSDISSGLTSLFTPFFDSINFDVTYEIDEKTGEVRCLVNHDTGVLDTGDLQKDYNPDED